MEVIKNLEAGEGGAIFGASLIFWPILEMSSSANTGKWGPRVCGGWVAGG
ncbi:predicted protein [Pyrenophora tritici-repentis Pt-1C-BFP]|uniref:Uncharacterized protein n=1 Tax=Pyrenophora tritici-repentis (strain Pt-1C-BFP) TaxID=426418 RepID=B2WB40_PYRTR|nr:uncharacterized protein PTRG_07503 [Pyrenophora tritici-repentis Pt-1C-BFP]EDU50422.1 predicted protein [Pyrenophora tritici-repentis Pt-1C-BFP]